jgi:hypothetical protein
MNYRNFSVSTDLNFFVFDNPNLKSTLYIDGGIRFSRTSIRDSIYTYSNNQIMTDKIVNEYGVSFLELYPQASLQFFTDERFGFTITERPSYLFLASDQISLNTYKNGTKELDGCPKRWVNMIEFLATLKINDNGKLFFRYRFTSSIDNFNDNFYQAQVGYSFNILKKQSKE